MMTNNHRRSESRGQAADLCCPQLGVLSERKQDPLGKRQSKSLEKEVLEVEGCNPGGQSLCHWTALCNENHHLAFIALGCR